MTDTTASIGAKGTDATGITEDMAAGMFHNVGRHYMAIVDLQVVDTRGPSIKGKRKVMLVIDSIEPATTEDLAEHLRELTRTLHFNRGVGHQPMLPGHDEPTVEGVMNAGAKHRPHPFLPVDVTIDNPICDVCGGLETAPVHSVQDQLEDADDEQDEDEGELEEPELDDEPEPDEDPDDQDAESAPSYGDPFVVPAG